MEAIFKYWKPFMGAALIVLAAGAQFAPAPVLRIAIHQGVEGVPLKRIADRFSQTLHSGGRVEVIELPYDELFQAERDALKSSIADSRFDVIQLDDPWLPALALRGGLLTLDEKALTGDPADFPDACLRVCRYPENRPEYFAVPFTGNSQLFGRRLADIPHQPRDWDEVLSLSKAEKNRLGFAMRLAPGNSLVTDFLPILWRYAPESFGENDYGALDSTAENAFRRFHDLASGQNWASADTRDVDVAASIAMHSSSSGVVWSAWAMALDRVENQVGDKLEFGWFPDNVSDLGPELGLWLLAIPRNSPHQSAAIDFIRFAVRKDQITRAARDGNPPPRRSVLKVSGGDFPSFPAQLWSLEHARPRTRTPCWRELEDALGSHLSRWTEDRSAKVMADLNRQILTIRSREDKLSHGLAESCAE